MVLLKNDNWIVDQFLHYNEKVVDMRDILNLLKTVNLEIVEWLGTPIDINQFIPDDSINALFKNLSTRDRLFVLDDLLKPKYLASVILHKCIP